MATRLFTDGLPLYGKRIPSAKVLPINDDLLFGNEFAQDAKVAVDTSSHEITFTDLEANRGDVKAAIAALRARHPPTHD